ncbi:MAG: hypothetical protein ACUVTL_08090 [Thermoproteota archaeon]
MIGDAAINLEDIFVGDDGIVVVPARVALDVLEGAEMRLYLEMESQKPYLSKIGLSLS